MMSFEWDEQKRCSSLEKHGLDFLDVSAVLDAPHVVVPAPYGDEERLLAIGLLEGRCVTVVYTIRSEAVRVIYFRRARYEEREEYQKLYGSRA